MLLMRNMGAVMKNVFLLRKMSRSILLASLVFGAGSVVQAAGGARSAGTGPDGAEGGRDASVTSPARAGAGKTKDAQGREESLKNGSAGPERTSGQGDKSPSGQSRPIEKEGTAGVAPNK